MTRLLLAFAALLALLPALTPPSAARPLDLATEPVPLNAGQPGAETTGALRFQGALALTSPRGRFGGLSGLAASPDGRRLIFVTDRGDWITATPRHDGGGRLIGLDRAETGALIGPDGLVPGGKRNRDAESIARLDGGYVVSFEHRHRLWRYRATATPFAAPPTAILAPAALYDAPPNGGIEALAALGDGRLFALAEKFPRDRPYLRGWIWTRGLWRGFRWRREGLFHPSGAVLLPGGDLLVLERRFTFLGGFAARLVRLDPAAIKPGALVTGREIARIEPPLIEENFEGIAALRAPGGGIRLYLISDDNFHPLQRTILVQFGLDG
ncbi:MAG: esterase-like activity of phytase family protein [Alphaproteobacteria bacterium]